MRFKFFLGEGSKRNNSEEELKLLKPNEFYVSHFLSYNSKALTIYFKNYNGLPCCTKPSEFKVASDRNNEFMTNQTINDAKINLQRCDSSSEAISNAAIPVRSMSLTSNDVPRIHQFSTIQVGRSNDSDMFDTSSIENSHKQFFYYVDPRLLDNFISIFSLLKRKLLNKDFQF